MLKKGETRRWKKKLTRKTIMVRTRAMKTSPSAQPLGFFDPPAEARTGVELRYIGRRRSAASGLIKLIYPATAGARYEPRFRIGPAIPQLRDRLKSEDQNPQRPKTNQPRRTKRQENTNGRSCHESSHTENRTATINPTPKSSFRGFRDLFCCFCSRKTEQRCPVPVGLADGAPLRFCIQVFGFPAFQTFKP